VRVAEALGPQNINAEYLPSSMSILFTLLISVELRGVTGTKGGFAISGFLTDTKLLFYLDVRSCIYVPPAWSRLVHIVSRLRRSASVVATRRNVVAPRSMLRTVSPDYNAPTSL
jgi:hypothetical protein